MLVRVTRLPASSWASWPHSCRLVGGAGCRPACCDADPVRTPAIEVGLARCRLFRQPRPAAGASIPNLMVAATAELAGLSPRTYSTRRSSASAYPSGMIAEAEALLREALALPVEDRADVAAELLASLDAPAADDPDTVRSLWSEELDRRACGCCPVRPLARTGRSFVNDSPTNWLGESAGQICSRGVG